MNNCLIGTTRCVQSLGSSPLPTRRPSLGICVPFSIQICTTIPNQHLTLLLTSLTKSPHFDHKCLSHTGKILPHPLGPLHRYNLPLYFEYHVASAIDLGSTCRSTTLQTLYSPPHLTGNVPDECSELSQLSSSHQTMARPQATRKGHGKGDPGIWFGSRMCIAAHE